MRTFPSSGVWGMFIFCKSESELNFSDRCYILKLSKFLGGCSWICHPCLGAQMSRSEARSKSLLVSCPIARGRWVATASAPQLELVEMCLCNRDCLLQDSHFLLLIFPLEHLTGDFALKMLPMTMVVPCGTRELKNSSSLLIP